MFEVVMGPWLLYWFNTICLIESTLFCYIYVKSFVSNTGHFIFKFIFSSIIILRLFVEEVINHSFHPWLFFLIML